MQKLVGALQAAALILARLGAGCGGSDEGPGLGPTDMLPGTITGTPDAASMQPVVSDASTIGQPPPTGNLGGSDAGMVTPPVTDPTRDGSVADASPVLGDASSDGGAVSTDGGTSPSGLTPIIRGDAPTQASASAKGPYKVMSYTSGFPVMSYGGGTIWYPTDAQAPFGAVAVCPGFTAAQSSIANWGAFLASHGIVTLTMDTFTPLDEVDMRAEELMDALASIKSENMRSGGPLYQKIDTMRLGVMGWSMGGGGSWLAANMHPELRTAVTFAGHIVTALNQDVSKITVPTLMFAGSTDNLILGGGMSQLVYDGIPATTQKMVWEVQGAGHNVANDPAGTGGAIGRYGLSWQKVYLEGDMRYYQFLLQMPPMASYFKTTLK